MKRVTDSDFVLQWQRAETANDAAVLLGMKLGTAAARAWRLRKAGVKLKKFPKGWPATDTAALNALIEGER